MEEERIRNLLRREAERISPPVGMWEQIEAQLGSPKPGRAFSLPLLQRWRLAIAAAMLALLLGTVAFYSSSVILAQLQPLLYFVPGLGIRSVDETTLVAKGPVTVREGGFVFTVESLLSNGKTTTVKYKLIELLGRKDGWTQARGDATARRGTYLRDAFGREYKLGNGRSGGGWGMA